MSKSSIPWFFYLMVGLLIIVISAQKMDSLALFFYVGFIFLFVGGVKGIYLFIISGKDKKTRVEVGQEQAQIRQQQYQRYQQTQSQGAQVHNSQQGQQQQNHTPQFIMCNRCGNRTAFNVNFCPICGNRLK